MISTNSMNLHIKFTILWVIIPVVSLYQHHIYVSEKRQQINNTIYHFSSVTELFRQLPNCCNSTDITIEPGNYNLSQPYELADLHDIRIRSETEAVIQCVANVNGINDSDTGIAFVRVRNLVITNIRIEGCGMKHVSTNHIGAGKFIIVHSAVYIQNSTNIILDNVTICESNGIGLLIYDTNGSVNITKTSFINNILNTSEQTENFTGGGGIYIEFTKCPPGLTQCDPKSNNFNKLANYAIDQCTFDGNAAIYHLSESEKELKYLANGVSVTFGTGGGISLWLSGFAQYNSFRITSTTFKLNRAFYGGGFHVHNRHNAKYNSVQIEWCNFTNNLAHLGGGGLILGYVIHQSREQCSHNTYIVANCMFNENQAKIGGGVSGFGSREPGRRQNTNYFEVCNSSFTNNGAQYGSAIQFNKEFFGYIVVGTIFTLVIDNCQFTNNSNKNDFSYNSSSVGAVALSEVNVEFRRTTVFTNNNSTALIADGASVKFYNDSQTTFQDNSGLHGGAISLISGALIIVYSNSSLTFQSNKALQYGGAIYVALSTPYDYFFSRTCFIKYYPENDSPSNWTTNITFNNNTAGNSSNSIFASTLKPCVKAYNVGIKSLFNYFSPSNSSIDISTSPAKFNLPYSNSNECTVVPGEILNIPVQLVDELDQNISSVMFIATCVGAPSGSPHVLSTYHFTNGSVKIAGRPNTICQLQMKTDSDYPVSTTVPIKLLNCPPGFVYNNKKEECECIVDHNPQNPAISGCELTPYQAYFDRFYWIGYESDDSTDLLISPCPYRYCYEDHISSQLLPRDAAALDKFVCGNRNRTGLLCGECIEGYSVALNSPTFTCHKCKNPCLGILYLLLSHIIPVSILFYIIMAYNIRMTTGPIGAFLFFSQIISSQYRFAFDYSVKANSNGTLAASNVLIAIYSISNLQFFHHDVFSYCLFPNAGTVDILAFNLLLSFYPVLLVFVYFLMRRYCTCKLQCYQRLRLSTKSVTHGVCAFLVLCFVKFNILAFGILRSADISYINKTSFSKVVYRQGSLRYFGEFQYSMYAIASIIIIVTVISIPIMIFVFHPIMILVARYFEWGETRFVVFINKILFVDKLKPILDSFQGDYKYNFDFFAGLHSFLYRIIFFCIMVAVPTSDINTLLLLMIAYFIIILLTHVLVMPFKRHVDNVSYTLIYILMLTIVILELYVFSTDGSSPILIWLEIILSLVPFIYVVLSCSWNFSLEIGNKIKKSRCCVCVDDESQLDDYRLLDFPGRIYDEDNSKVVSWSFTDNNNDNHSDEHNDDNNTK